MPLPPANLPPLRVLVVDDSALYRKVVRAVLEQLPNVEVIGHAQNGRLALDRIIADRPDVITLDMEMPELDGLGLLRELEERKHRTLGNHDQHAYCRRRPSDQSGPATRRLRLRPEADVARI